MKKYKQYRSELQTSLTNVIQEIYLLEEEKQRLLRQMHDNNNLIVEKQVEGDKIIRDINKESFSSAQSAADTLGINY